MRVLHVTPYFAPAFRYGGPPQSILGLCQGLLEAGVEVEVFTTTANGPEPLAPAPEGRVYDGVRARYFPLTWPRRSWRSVGLAQALAAAGRAADLVHVHGLWNHAAWTGVRTARAAGVPYAISVRGMLQPAARAHHAASKALAFAMVERQNLRGASFLHATSTDEAQVLSPFGPPVVTLPNGVSPIAVSAGHVARVLTLAGLPADAEVVLFLGRVHPIKRLDLLAAAFLRLHGTRPQSCLVIAGPDEDGYRGRIEPLLAPVAGSVRWLGPVQGLDKWSWLAAARALVQCSDSESFGMSVAEGLSVGTPVLVTDWGPWHDLQEHGCVWRVPHDAAAMAGGLGRVLDRGPDVAETSARGRAFAEHAFSWSAIAAGMRQAYERALSRARTAA